MKKEELEKMIEEIIKQVFDTKEEEE